MAAPTPSEQRIDAAIERATAVKLRQKKNSTYLGNYKRFVAWREEASLLPSTVGDYPLCYVTRESVDQYFLEVVPTRNGDLSTIRRIVYSLQWGVDSVEHPNGPSFTVKNGETERGIQKQKEDWITRSADVHGGTDPHKGLRDLMSEEDQEKLVDNIFNYRNDWSPLITSWCLGTQAGLRGDSNRKLVWCDLNLSHGFGPEKRGRRSRLLMVVLRKGLAHKDRFTTEKQVGLWRHRNYKRCGVFAVAINLFSQLRVDTTTDFYHENRNKRAPWWDNSIVDFSTYNQESAAMQQVLQNTGVRYHKVTHHRSQCVQTAGA
jgi:hypothetical protein